MPPMYVEATSHDEGAETAFDKVFAARPGVTVPRAGITDHSGIYKAIEVSMLDRSVGATAPGEPPALRRSDHDLPRGCATSQVRRPPRMLQSARRPPGSVW
ncbi:hypothetical protein GCM10010199_08990 [Dactylosporangium roseum]